MNIQYWNDIAYLDVFKYFIMLSILKIQWSLLKEILPEFVPSCKFFVIIIMILKFNMFTITSKC